MSDFVSYLHEVFADFGPIQTKRMFGGHGVYHDGLMFGLVADDALYLKVDEEIRPLFEQQDLGPFEYNKQGKILKLSYHAAPPEILENREQASHWARLSFGAALRANAAKENKKKRQNKPLSG